MFLGDINYKERKFGEWVTFGKWKDIMIEGDVRKTFGVPEVFYFLSWVVVFGCLFCDKLSSYSIL